MPRESNPETDYYVDVSQTPDGKWAWFLGEEGKSEWLHGSSGHPSAGAAEKDARQYFKDYRKKHGIRSYMLVVNRSQSTRAQQHPYRGVGTKAFKNKLLK